MLKSLLLFVSLFIGFSLMVACQSPKQSTEDVPITATPPVVSKPVEATQCKKPRSPVCTKEYRPVCATRSTDVRCVIAPCSSTELVTKSNSCTACADEKVSGFVQGACS